jgi:Uma2 family endonuclease
MSQLDIPTTALVTVADVLASMADIPANRIWLHPAPGTATEQDVVDVHDHKNRLCELVDGVLVEKAIGFYESYLTIELIKLIGSFADAHDLGIVAGADGMIRLAPGLVRIPDISFVSWDRLHGRRVPRDPIARLVPDLAVEVLSESNTAAEMRRKVREYFTAGVRCVWLVDPESRTAVVYSDLGTSVTLHETDTLDGGQALPGFSLQLKDLFEKGER